MKSQPFAPLIRSGSGNLNALWVVQASNEMSFAWNDPYDNSENTEATSTMTSYEKVLKFNIPNPEDQNISPEIHSEKLCQDHAFSPVTVKCLQGQCNMPKRMYTGTDTLGVCQGHAYGLVSVAKEEKNQMCDWRINKDTGRTAFYVGIDGTPKCSGIVDTKRPKGQEDGIVPTTVGIWVR